MARLSGCAVCVEVCVLSRFAWAWEANGLPALPPFPRRASGCLLVQPELAAYEAEDETEETGVAEGADTGKYVSCDGRGGGWVGS